MNRKLTFIAIFCGALFGAGLVLGGMTMPAKVIGFLDVFGAWDPSLAFVMGGAVLTFGTAYAFSRKTKRPFVNDNYLAPTATAITPQLLVGASLFGIGWGLGGFCPGPALVASVSGFGPLIFVAAMAVGMRLSKPFRN